ncbi:hypothetical protein ATANTOWER_002945 [Ataeniobius toweri]|uniref:Uncharacterized protein n=1 Tax=Ataeniobius toweri TaxID=208326 RepID=A0ABU7A5D1_9TELE|nr:hypothetical protein [Ataeniobius toweri]
MTFNLWDYLGVSVCVRACARVCVCACVYVCVWMSICVEKGVFVLRGCMQASLSPGAKQLLERREQQMPAIHSTLGTQRKARLCSRRPQQSQAEKHRASPPGQP